MKGEAWVWLYGHYKMVKTKKGENDPILQQSERGTGLI